MITTSRYASILTRKLAVALSRVLDRRYLSRGKKTIHDLVLLSRKKGWQHILVIKERGKKPVAIDIINITWDLKWEWAGSIGIIYEN